jgi:pilus assembly protein CpaB
MHVNNRRRIIGVLAALLLAIIGTVALVSYVQSAKEDAVADETLVDVYVVASSVPKGADAEAIKSSVKVEQVPQRLLQDGAITNLDDVDDVVAAADLLPGDQLLEGRLVAPEAVTEEVTDKVQISARLSAERAVGGTLQKGDLVGVYLSFDPFELDASGQASSGGDTADGATGPKKSPNMTRMEFQQVLVTNVQSVEAPVTVDGETDQPVVQVTATEYVVTLALSPEQSERFAFAAEFGHVWLSLQPASVSDDGTRLVTLGDVYEVVR